MGKLKSSLQKAVESLNSLSDAVEDAAKALTGAVNDTWMLMQIASNGVDELYLYIHARLKKDGKKYSEASAQTIAEFADGNVKTFLKGIGDGCKNACAKTAKWSELGGDLDGQVVALKKALDDIGSQLGKKKKKLLQSKTYKAKLATYEQLLTGLSDSADDVGEKLKVLLENQPPPASQIKKVLDIGADHTLAALDNAASKTTKDLLQKYGDHKSTTEGEAKKMRQAGNFSAELKRIQQWIQEADDMEAEGEE